MSYTTAPSVGNIILTKEKPMNDRIEYLLELNSRNAAQFDEDSMRRRLYRTQHPTEILALKCMDGRVHLPVMTRTPLGIIQPFRTLGGIFDLGWPFFQSIFKDSVDYAHHNAGRPVLVLATYHFSRGESHRGCRGFNYDGDRARHYTRTLKEQLDRVFGRDEAFFTVQIGIETDLDSFFLHGENGEVVDTSNHIGASESDVTTLLARLYPSMPRAILRDFVPLVYGNILHSAEIRVANRPLTDAEHKEWGLFVGRGFDWFHETNKALIVGPFANFVKATATAAGLLRMNVEEKRVEATPENPLVLFACAPYRDPIGPEPRLAAEKARYLCEEALNTIRDQVPEIMPYVRTLTGTVDSNTRRLNVISRG